MQKKKENFQNMINDYKNNDLTIHNIIDNVDNDIIKKYVLNENFGN